MIQEITVYRVSWPISERNSELDPGVFYNLEDAQEAANNPDGWYGATGDVMVQKIKMNTKNHQITSLSKPLYYKGD